MPHPSQPATAEPADPPPAKKPAATSTSTSPPAAAPAPARAAPAAPPDPPQMPLPHARRPQHWPPHPEGLRRPARRPHHPRQHRRRGARQKKCYRLTLLPRTRIMTGASFCLAHLPPAFIARLYGIAPELPPPAAPTGGITAAADCMYRRAVAAALAP
jgi:hypothetical protein